MELFNKKAYTSEEKYQDHLLEQYKLCTEMANKISDRRIATNNFYLTINTALLSVYGLIKVKTNHQMILLAVIGLIISYSWYCIINSYKKINSAKYKTINKIEDELACCPYQYEWDIVCRQSDYKKFSDVEKYIPFGFMLFYGFIAVYFMFTNIIYFIFTK